MTFFMEGLVDQTDHFADALVRKNVAQDNDFVATL